MNNDFYREEILRHYRSPQNSFVPKTYTHQTSLDNPVCGDSIKIFLQIKNKTVSKINYQIKGCAIAVYSASVLSEKLNGLSIKTVLQLDSQQILGLLKLQLTPIRAKCALLPYLAIKKALV